MRSRSAARSTANGPTTTPVKTTSFAGRVLIIEGTIISGTQTAWEFVRDPKFFAEFEAGLKEKDDKLGPYFEVLVRTYALAMNATKSSHVTHRILEVEREIPIHP